MPKVSTIGLVNKVRAVDADTVVSDDDTWITAGPGWLAAHTIKLPGPSSTPDNLPSNGDFYNFGDPQGRLGGGHAVIDGGGYPIQGSSTITLGTNFTEATFTFDDTNQAWIACVCIPLD